MAPGSAKDDETGLPTVVVHERSGITLVLIHAGAFAMGAAPEGPDAKDEPLHTRTIWEPFYISVTEVTTGQFRRFVEATGYETDAERGARDAGHGVDVGTIDRGAFAATESGDRDWSTLASWRRPFPNLPGQAWDDDHPVILVSWTDAVAFCSHNGLHLPSEAQWEYAYRAGSRTRYFWGDAPEGGADYGNVADAAAKARFPSRNDIFRFDDGQAVLGPVGAYRPNAWGVKDMTGSLQEWTQDAYTRDPSNGIDESAVATDSPTAPRVVRGCSWVDGPDLCRATARFGMTPTSRRDFIGFRVVLAATPAP